MGRRSQKHHHSAARSHTLPSSPTRSFSSSSSSDFEFTISHSPHKSSAALCPADELFYKGQLLPLQLSPRLSMVRTLLLSSSSISSSSDTTTTASRDSTASYSSTSSSDLLHHLDCDSSRPSSVTDDEFKRLTTARSTTTNVTSSINFHSRKSSKYFPRFKLSSVFRKDQKDSTPAMSGAAAVKRMSSNAKEVIRKYFKKVRPLYEKLSHKQQQQQQKSSSRPHPGPQTPPPTPAVTSSRTSTSANTTLFIAKDRSNYPASESLSRVQSFSGNLRYPRRRRSYISSCPSSMGSSPNHIKHGFSRFTQMGRVGSGTSCSESSSMEELQSAIQGAIAHCKSSMMLQSKSLVSNEI